MPKAVCALFLKTVNRKQLLTEKTVNQNQEKSDRELTEANLKVEALNVLIDLAEEHGMPVRKNSAAKR